MAGINKAIGVRMVDKDGNVRVFESLSKCAAALGVHYSRIRKKMENGNRAPKRGCYEPSSLILAQYEFYPVEETK